MIEQGEIKALTKGLMSAVKQYVSDFIQSISDRIDALEKSIKEPQKGEPGLPGKDAIVDMPAIVSEVIRQIPVPRDGINGKDADPVNIPGIVAEVVCQIPIPRDGKDAEVDIPGIVSQILKQIPIPQNGINGRDGRDGLPGPPGEKGDSIVGPIGLPGKDAEPVDAPKIVAEILRQIPIPRDGKDGIDGADGASIVGPIGPAGKDAEVDIPGIITEVLKQIPVPKDGSDGRDGKDGESIIGPAGPMGRPGEKGESIVGPPGPQGLVGPKGESIQGPQGPQGLSGRDALQLDILPSIDISRSYPRGIYARYDGGIIRSFRDTVPAESLEKSGWEVVVAGVAEISVDFGSNFRTFMVNTRKTGEEIKQAVFGIPILIYRGIYKVGEKYERGDVATWGGSAWHCQNPTVSAPNENSSDWKLMVKEGRKGKDGKDGAQGLQGIQGRPGMDRIG